MDNMGTPTPRRDPGDRPRRQAGSARSSSQSPSRRSAPARSRSSVQAPPVSVYASRKRVGSKGKYFLIAVVVVVLLGIGAFVGSRLLSSDKPISLSGPVTVAVPSGASTNTIAQLLKDKGLIRDESAFVAKVQSAGYDGKLQAGTYVFTSADPDTLVQTLAAGPTAGKIKLVIPEGYTNKQIAARVQEKVGIPADDFLKIADHQSAKYASKYPFLKGAYNGSMQGYLFPKTYSVSADSSADDIVSMMLNQFAQETSSLDLTTAEKAGLSESDVVTMGSIIEKEVSVPSERKLVSSVIYNRLDQGMKLQMCSTVEYLLGKKKVRLTNADTSIESPYNTYINKGLPPGPICNPGLASIEAAAHPAQTTYLYYVLTGKDGSQTFSSTLAEHNKAKQRSKEVLGQ